MNVVDAKESGSHPRVIERPPLPPVYLIEEEQVPTVVLPTWPVGTLIPFTIYIDTDHHVHVEYAHNGLDPTYEKRHLFKWFLNPLSYYRRIAPQVVDASLVSQQRQLLGGATFHYYTAKQEVYSQYWGIFSPEQARERGIDPQTLEGAAKHFLDVVHDFNRHLGIRTMRTTTCVPAVTEHLKAFGWEEYQPTTWRERWELFIGTFPVSLRRRERLMRKVF